MNRPCLGPDWGQPCPYNALTPQTRCPACRRRRQLDIDRRRGTPSARGYGSAWQDLRAAVLAAEPQCRQCGAPATEVDHIIPLGQPGGASIPSNVRPLCRHCHTVKTWRSRNPKGTDVGSPAGGGRSQYPPKGARR